MAKRGPPVLKLLTACIPTKTEANEQARLIGSPQQNPQLEPEVIVPPDQVPDLALPNPQDRPACSPPTHIPDPIQPQNPPMHVPIQIQPLNPPAHGPNPILSPAPPVQIPQLNWPYFKPEFSGKPEEDVEAHLL